MNRSSTHLLRTASLGSLILACSVLIVPVAATLLFPERHLEWAGVLWFLALVPTFHLAYRFGWPGASAAMGGSVALLVLVHLAAAPLGRGVPDTLAWVLPVLLATGVGLGWLSHRLGDIHGGGDPSARMDAVTGLPSERYARVLLESEFWSAERGRLLTLILFQLDGIQEYADRRGPAAAEEATATFGQILGSTTRRMNLSARSGQTRFMSILDGTDEEGGSLFAERVRDAYASTHSDQPGLSIRAGVAAYHPSMNGPDDLVAAAGLALERAREDGADVRIFGHPGSAPKGTPPSPSLKTEGPGSAHSVPDRAAARGEERTGRIALDGRGRRILLVEGDTSTRTLISTHLQKQGFAVTEATNASEALRALGEEFHLFITDLQLPESPGSHLISTFKARWPDTPTVAITGFQDAQLAAEALSSGADRYLYRPFGMPELEAHLEDLLTLRTARVKHRREREEVGAPDTPRAHKTRQEVLAAIHTLVRATEIQDAATRGHSERVRSYTLILFDAMGTRAQGDLDRNALGVASTVHEVGKLSVPEEILNKTGPLTDDEYARVRRHPLASHDILASLLPDDVVLAVARWHHERWDGEGYPDGLAAQAIPLPARIVALADSLDAMTSPRAYRAGLDWEDAVGQIRTRTGSHFDPGLLPVFEEALPALREIYDAAFPDGTPEATTGGHASSTTPPSGEREDGSASAPVPSSEPIDSPKEQQE